MNGPPQDDRLALYVHWPFCLSKCPYCDFNSHVREDIDQARWRRALLNELDLAAERLPGRRLASVFFGGGTPSLMEPETCAAVIARAKAHWPAAEGCEITLEANPSSADAERLRAFRDAGVDRLSLGVQALDEAALRFLGRLHDARRAVETAKRAREIFPRFSIDLIYGRPGQTVAAWHRELTRALALAPSHLSLYQLTIEKGTPFYAAERDGAFALPPEDDAVALYEATQAVLEAAGLPAYEISNHARPGEECRHNLVYWRYEDYAGIGPGAHGRIKTNGAILATRTAPRPEDWLAQSEANGHATVEERWLAPSERVAECLMMGLRLAEGVRADRFGTRTGIPLEEAVPAERSRPLEAAGFLERDEEGIRATRSGRRLLNALLARLIPDETGR